MSDARLASDDVREALTALRDLLVERLLLAEVRETAPLAKQFAEVVAALNAMPGEEKSDLDDLTARRDARRSALPDASAVGSDIRTGRS